MVHDANCPVTRSRGRSADDPSALGLGFTQRELVETVGIEPTQHSRRLVSSNLTPLTAIGNHNPQVQGPAPLRQRPESLGCEAFQDDAIRLNGSAARSRLRPNPDGVSADETA